MSVIEALRTNKAARLIAIVLSLAAVGFCAYTLVPAKASAPQSRAFFTVDDGATWFEDGLSHVPPFEREGKTAYGVRVFTCDGGKTRFAGYLIRYTPAAKQKLEQAIAELKDRPDITNTPIFSAEIAVGGAEVKKPGSGNEWVPAASAAYEQLTNPKCDQGTLDSVLP